MTLTFDLAHNMFPREIFFGNMDFLKKDILTFPKLYSIRFYPTENTWPDFHTEEPPLKYKSHSTRGASTSAALNLILQGFVEKCGHVCQVLWQKTWSELHEGRTGLVTRCFMKMFANKTNWFWNCDWLLFEHGITLRDLGGLMILSLKMFWALKFSRNLVNTSRVVRGKIVKIIRDLPGSWSRIII